MFEIDYICENVYDLWFRDEGNWLFLGTFATYEDARTEADSYDLIGL